jgi:Tfp pilus assembly protein PilV
MRTRGTALIESLVAMTIFTIGSAATGAWLVQSMAYDARASRTMAAVAIAASLEQRLRANRAAALAGAYNADGVAVHDCAGGCGTPGLARDDLFRFREALRLRLGDAVRGHAYCGSDGRCVIAIAWRESEVLTWRIAL